LAWRSDAVDDGDVADLARFDVGPHVTGCPVGEGLVGGHLVTVAGVDPGGGEDLGDDGAAVGAVLGQRLAGPLPRAQDSSTGGEPRCAARVLACSYWLRQVLACRSEAAMTAT